MHSWPPALLDVPVLVHRGLEPKECAQVPLAVAALAIPQAENWKGQSSSVRNQQQGARILHYRSLLTAHVGIGK